MIAESRSMIAQNKIAIRRTSEYVQRTKRQLADLKQRVGVILSKGPTPCPHCHGDGYFLAPSGVKLCAICRGAAEVPSDVAAEYRASRVKAGSWPPSPSQESVSKPNRPKGPKGGQGAS